MTTPTPNTMLPQAVRIAKLVGTVGSAYAAGAYLSTSGAVIPALAHQTGRELAITLSSLKDRLGKPILIASSTASAAFGYVAYILYSTPTLLVPLASITTSQSSFLPHVESTDLVIGGGWEFYAGAAAALASIIPWHMLAAGPVEQRLDAAASSVKTATVNDVALREDVQRKKRANIVSGGLALVGLGLAGYGQAWW